MKEFARNFLRLAVLGCIAAGVLHLGFAEPFFSSFVGSAYWLAALGVLLGVAGLSAGPTPDKRFKTGFKKNETTQDYAEQNSKGGAILLASISMILSVYFLVSPYLLSSGSPAGTRPVVGRLMSVKETREWISQGPEWREAAWRASGCPEELDESWVADPRKRADFYRVVRTDVRLRCASE